MAGMSQPITNLLPENVLIYIVNPGGGTGTPPAFYGFVQFFSKKMP